MKGKNLLISFEYLANYCFSFSLGAWSLIGSVFLSKLTSKAKLQDVLVSLQDRIFTLASFTVLAIIFAILGFYFSSKDKYQEKLIAEF